MAAITTLTEREIKAICKSISDERKRHNRTQSTTQGDPRTLVDITDLIETYIYEGRVFARARHRNTKWESIRIGCFDCRLLPPDFKGSNFVSVEWWTLYHSFTAIIKEIRFDYVADAIHVRIRFECSRCHTKREDTLKFFMNQPNSTDYEAFVIKFEGKRYCDLSSPELVKRDDSDYYYTTRYDMFNFANVDVYTPTGEPIHDVIHHEMLAELSKYVRPDSSKLFRSVY